MSHLGRPGGKFKREELSLAVRVVVAVGMLAVICVLMPLGVFGQPIAKILEGYLANIATVRFLNDCVGPEVEREVNAAVSHGHIADTHHFLTFFT